MSSNSPFVYPPSVEERAQIAEQLQQFDEANAANDRVGSFEHGGDIAHGAPRSYVQRSDQVDATIPAPAAPTFYVKHSSTPRSGTSVGPDDIVELHVPGMGLMKTNVEVALSMGLIARDPAGGYRGLDAGERNDKAAMDQQEQQQQRADANAELVTLRATGDAADADTSRLIDAVVQAVPSRAVQQLAHDFVVNGGTMSAQAVAGAAEMAGWSPDQGIQVAERLVAGMSKQAAAAVVSQGVPVAELEAAYAWMQEVDPVAHQHAALNLILNSDATELKRLAKAYYRHRVVRQDA